MSGINPASHKSQLQHYFDGVGFERWSAIYGDADLSRIRRTIREGHEQMLAQVEMWLLDDRKPKTLLDAGCGTGLLSVRMAQHGINVRGIDIAPRMISAASLAAENAQVDHFSDFSVGDVETVDGQFDAAVCLDVLVHYPHNAFSQLCTHLAQRSTGSFIMTYAPYNRLLAMLHWLGGRFPKGERRTDIQMIPERVVKQALAEANMKIFRQVSISHGFYHVTLLEARR